MYGKTVSTPALLAAPCLAALVLAACSALPAVVREAKGAPLAIMTTWSVPSQSIKAGAEFFLQVRIAAETRLEHAEVAIETPADTFLVRGATRFALGTVMPAPVPPVSQAPNPPALGMTLVRSFAMTPFRSGSHDISVTLQTPSGKKQIVVHTVDVMP